MLHAKRAVVVDPRDNVATALDELEIGDAVALAAGEARLTVELIDHIPFGHKFGLFFIKTGSSVLKYGEVIGVATRDIAPGEHVHIHNVASTRGRGDLAGQGQ